nr:unnamed protein product [Callosobruchus chinensis]
MDDNARPHRIRAVQQALENGNIARLECPAMSPDMNPIEHVWDYDFLFGRKIAVAVDGFSSSFHNNNAGVPQGSVLAPMLFNDLLSSTTNPIHSFADDSTLHAGIMSNRPISVVELERRRLATAASLSKDQEAITAWGLKNMVEINASKTQYCTLSNKRCPSEHSVLMNNQALPRTAGKKLGYLFRARKYFSPSNLLTLYKAQIRPSLDYCSHIWGAAAPTTLSILDAVQRRAIRLVGHIETAGNENSDTAARAGAAQLNTPAESYPLRMDDYLNANISNLWQLQWEQTDTHLRLLQPTIAKFPYLNTLTSRACRQAPETLMHLLSACKTYAGTAYVHRHNAALRVLHSYGMYELPVLPYAPGDIESVVENERCRIYWNYSFPTLELVQANKPDIVLLDHQQKTMFVIEFSAPDEVNIFSKEEEKRTKYQELLGKLRRLWPDYAVSLLVMVIGSLGGMRNTLLSALRVMPVCRAAAHILAARMQKAVILGSLRLLRAHDTRTQ